MTTTLVPSQQGGDRKNEMINEGGDEGEGAQQTTEWARQDQAKLKTTVEAIGERRVSTAIRERLVSTLELLLLRPWQLKKKTQCRQTWNSLQVMCQKVSLQFPYQNCLRNLIPVEVKRKYHSTNKLLPLGRPALFKQFPTVPSASQNFA